MDFLKTIGGGMVGALPGMMLGGPIGGLVGFGIGAYGASEGLQGKSGAKGGALIGGIAGFMIGGPIGAIAGGVGGGLLGKITSKLFGKKEKPPQQAPYYPPMPFYPGMMGGMQMGGMGMGMGMQMGGMGMGMMMGGMMMPQGGFGGFGMVMAGGMFGPQQGQGMGMGMMGMMGAPNQGGQLKQDKAGGPIEYTTSGGYKVNVNKHTITITDPSGKNTVKHWGDPHENVNGKTIKDWEGKDRSLILGDGTKITMNAQGPQGVVENMSIYDGAQGIHIDNKKNQINNVTFNPMQTAMQEAYQPDGETSYVGYNKKGEFIYHNLYTQDQNLGIKDNFKLLAKGENAWWGGQTAQNFYNRPGLFWA